jgi:hypothetical protein
MSSQHTQAGRQATMPHWSKEEKKYLKGEGKTKTSGLQQDFSKGKRKQIDSFGSPLCLSQTPTSKGTHLNRRERVDASSPYAL